MNLAPWLCLSGDELGNAIRTLTYLRRGLGSPWVDVATSAEFALQAVSRYDDIYDDIYDASLELLPTYDEADLACYCEALDEGPYVSPADDDAPWYDAGRPESGDFLGLVPTGVQLLTAMRRGAQATGRGSVIGPQTATGMVVAVRGQMMAASAEGMAWGERWLAEVLGAGLCDDRLDLEVLLACPADVDDARFRTLPDVGLIDGPIYGATAAPECYWQEVAFQLASASPWLLAPEVVARAAAPLAADTTAYAQVLTDTWQGGAGIRVEVVTGPAGMANLVVRGLVGQDAACPPANAMPCWGFTVPALAPGHRLVVDGSTEEAYVENPATGQVVGGLELLDFDGQFAYPNAASCSAVCVEIRHSLSGAGSLVSVSSRGREL